MSLKYPTNKKQKSIFFIVIIILITIVLPCAWKWCIKNQKYYIRDEITSATISSSVENTVSVSNPTEIQILLDCIRLVKRNNKYKRYNIMTAPNSYTVSFTLADGSIKTFDYTTYPSYKYEAPFKEFYNLSSVKTQLNK